jgi:exonuclease SbcD
MKILHTADWHLGHRLNNLRWRNKLYFLSWIENYIKLSKSGGSLIAGDIFDTGTPSNQSLENVL